MIVSLLILLLVSNAVTLKREKSIMYSRVVISGLVVSSLLTYNNLHVTGLSSGIYIYGGLFNITAFTQGFNLFILIIISSILILTAFLLRKVTILKIRFSFHSIKISGFLSSIISIVTLLLILFTNMPSEWFNVVSILYNLLLLT